MAAGAVVTVMFAEPEMFKNPTTAEVAVQVAVPGPDGVKTPPEVMVPPVAVQFTAELKIPVPETVAAQVVFCVVVMEGCPTATEIERIVKGAEVTAIFAEPEMLV